MTLSVPVDVSAPIVLLTARLVSASQFVYDLNVNKHEPIGSEQPRLLRKEDAKSKVSLISSCWAVSPSNHDSAICFCSERCCTAV